MKINPVKIWGPWKEGYALDKHLVSSVYIGDNEWGRPLFDNTRSDIGQLIYEFKYRGNKNVLNDILNLVLNFLVKTWQIHKYIDIVVPSNVNRQFQPVFELCKAVARKINVPCDLDLLNKIKGAQLKGLDYSAKEKAVADSMVVNHCYEDRVNILLVDDLYDSGLTLKTAARLIQKQRNVLDVYVLTMTKTRGS